MPSIRLARVPISTADIEDLAIVTEKLADGAVVPAKVGAGVMSDRKVLDHTGTPYSLGPGSETSLGSVSGRGATVVLYSGDGDGVFNMRAYEDGSLDEEFPTNEARAGIYDFTTSLEIRLYNPTGSSITQTSSTFNLRGVAR